MTQGEERPALLLVVPLAVLVLAALALFFALGRSGDGGGSAEAGAGNGEEVQREAERLEAEFARRDRRQIEDLTETARGAVEDLAPALDDMAQAMPPGEEPADETVPPGEVERWKGAVRGAAARFGDPPSGETGTNVARGSLDAAVDTLESSVLTYEAALALPEGERGPVLERAAAQRDLAVRVWSVGATQLDAINIEAGNGHQHVYLPAPGVAGALEADPAPEGSEARED